jgi:hypothetical protein
MPHRNNPYLGAQRRLPRMTSTQFCHGPGVAEARDRLYHGDDVHTT